MTTPIQPGKAFIYVEDPGAANMAAYLPGPLSKSGVSCRMCAAGQGAAQLERMGVSFIRLDKANWSDAGDASILVIGTSENPTSPAFSLLRDAKGAGCPTVGLVDGAANAGMRFRGLTDEPLAHAPEWLVVPDGKAARAYSELGYDKERILISGHPHFDGIRTEGAHLLEEGRKALRCRLLPEFSETEQIIVFLAEVSDGLEAGEFHRSRDYQLSGRGRSHKRTDIVLEEVLDVISQIEPRPRFVLRLHPKNEREEFIVYEDDIDLVSYSEPALALVCACDVIVGMTSSLLIEAAILGLPVLSVTPRDIEREWLGCAASAIPCVHTRAQLGPALKRAMSGVRPDVSRLEKIYPPGAASRIAAFVATIALA